MTRRISDGDGPELNSKATRELEAAIFSARNFVVPSPDLRPRTLEQARDAYRIHMWVNRIAVIALGCMFFWSVAAATMRYFGKHRDKIAGPFPEELEQRAESYASQDRYETQWRLVEAFQQERRLPARDDNGRTIQTPEHVSPKNGFLGESVR